MYCNKSKSECSNGINRFFSLINKYGKIHLGDNIDIGDRMHILRKMDTQENEIKFFNSLEVPDEKKNGGNSIPELSKSYLDVNLTTKPKIKHKKYHSCSSITMLQNTVTSTTDLPKRKYSVKNLNINDGKVFSSQQLEIQDVLGEGFYGRVFKILDRDSGETMVMKELKNLGLRSEKQFINELELLKQVNHQNLLRYIGIVLIKDRINIICEYISGGTLRKLIKNETFNLTALIKQKIVLDISAGMTYLHSKNIAHRDLTSKNCMLRDIENFDVVVTDFGLSRVMKFKPSDNSENEPETEECLERVGTPYWMAPEMLVGLSYNLSVDVFSFGIVLCELLSRKSAHPDNIPRTNNFGLDSALFIEKIKHINNPAYLISLAISCCDVRPQNRPLFSKIYYIVNQNYVGDKRKRSMSNFPIHKGIEP